MTNTRVEQKWVIDFKVRGFHPWTETIIGPESEAEAKVRALVEEHGERLEDLIVMKEFTTIRTDVTRCWWLERLLDSR